MYGYGYQYGTIKGEGGGGGLPFTPPLDVYTGAAAAYSLRLLRSAYAGSSIRVRRSSDNAESDIGFVSGVLDTATLLTFCGAGNGFVTTWYDQSGNTGRNATQSTAANQPQIVSSGALVVDGGKVACLFDGTNDMFNISSFSVSAANYNSFVGSRESVSVNLFGLSNLGSNAYFSGLSNDNKYYLLNKTNAYQISTSTDSTTSRILLTGLSNGGGSEVIYKNGSTVSSSSVALAISMNINSIGLYASSLRCKAKLQEIILYNSDQSGNRTGIETNINTYYGIY